jgi:hypothetical protein
MNRELTREELWVLFKLSVETQRYGETVTFLTQIASTFEELSRGELESVLAAYKLAFADRRAEV